MRHPDIQQTIQDRYDALPRSQRRLADFLAEHLDRVPFWSVQELAAKSGASVASVVRLAQGLGFSGYSELRERIAEGLQSHLESQAIFPQVENLEDDTLTSVANIDIKNINETLGGVARGQFQKAADLLTGARRVFAAGLGLSYHLADLLAYQLTQVGIDARALRQGPATFPEQALFADGDDCLVVFSFPPYSPETIELARFAGERGIPVVAVTNRPTAPVSFHAGTTLIVKSENMLFTNSFAAISVLINALSTECALWDQERARRMLDHLNELMKRASS